METEINLNTIVSAASLIVAITALSLNNRYASLRDKRKELRGRLEEIIEKIAEIEYLSVKFHTNDAFDDLIADEINWKIDRVSKYIQSISIFPTKSTSQAFIDYKKSITSSNFGPSKFQTQKASSEILRDIHAMSSKLTSNLMKIYDSAHPLK